MSDKETIQRIIRNNYKIIDETKDTGNCVGFIFQEAFIYDPTLDETGRFPVNPTEYYGEQNLKRFIENGSKVIE